MKVYTYKNCDTCRKAVKWLRENGLTFQEVPIREQPPTIKELQTMLGYQGELRALFNTSGGDYREMNLKETLPGMKEADALKLLSGNGNLVKRPFLLAEGIGLVGFKEAEWREKLIK